MKSFFTTVNLHNSDALQLYTFCFNRTIRNLKELLDIWGLLTTADCPGGYTLKFYVRYTDIWFIDHSKYHISWKENNYKCNKLRKIGLIRITVIVFVKGVGQNDSELRCPSPVDFVVHTTTLRSSPPVAIISPSSDTHNEVTGPLCAAILPQNLTVWISQRLSCPLAPPTSTVLPSKAMQLSSSPKSFENRMHPVFISMTFKAP